VTAPEPDHRELMNAAIERDGVGQRALFDGDQEAARSAFAAAAQLYRRSWELAPPNSYGRVVGMLKSAVLAGGGPEEAEFARSELGDADLQSPAAAYARALAALILGDETAARRWSEAMRAGPEAFIRTAEAVDALAARDRARYAAALRAIVEDFEQRSEHLTGIPIADTALMLERLGARRAIDAGVASPLLPRL
jgi:hypothetical protein